MCAQGPIRFPPEALWESFLRRYEDPKQAMEVPKLQ